jgi:transcriptional regulator GlxA family with amidase domain
MRIAILTIPGVQMLDVAGPMDVFSEASTHGRSVALRVAKELILFLKRPGGQSQFSVHLEAQAQHSSRIITPGRRSKPPHETVQL